MSVLFSKYRSCNNTLESCFFQISSFFTCISAHNLCKDKESSSPGTSIRKKTYKQKRSIGSSSNDDGNGNKNGRKAIGLDWQNNNFARASHLFAHFLAFVAQLRHEFLISSALFMEVGEHKKRIFFLLLNLDTVLSDSTPEDFPNIWQIEGRWCLKRCEFTLCLRFVSYPEICYQSPPYLTQFY